jgi:mannan endo-1,4-beta-mannosidase
MYLSFIKNLFCAGFLLIVFALPSCRDEQRVIAPVNPHASVEARELLSQLYKMQGEKILSGQHNYYHALTRSTDTVISWTGKTPVVWGFDLRDGLDWEASIEEAVRQHQAGSVITSMTHMSKPFESRDTVPRSPWGALTDDAWQDLITPGTDIHQLFLTRLDRIAEGLKALQDVGVPVLWRPFHEMNGVWFWWGNRAGPEGVQALWILMYERYTGYHGLNNLIWVWNPNAPRDWEDDEAYDYHLFYPGHDYVDVLAADIYKGDYKQSHHDDLLALGEGKPIALGEVGELPSPEIFEQQPMWTWFMTWANWIWTHNTPEQVRAIYDSPRVVVRGE